ncbi:hypothetical protein GC169_00550 [bacterium]|nr:hypothetical protein [bacterium]
MKNLGLTAKEVRALVVAGLLETVCIAGGVAGYLATDRMIWIAIGVLAGVGVSLPAVITLVKARKERDRASR